MRKEPKYYKTKYTTFYFTNDFDISYETCGYFDNRPRIIIAIIFFRLVITIPIRNKWTDECDSPKWGIAIHNATLWIYHGGKGNWNGGKKYWAWSIPFITQQWMKTSILLKDGTWADETLGDRKDFFKKEWKDQQQSWTYEFTDKYDGEKILTTFYVEMREWRPKWLTWTSLFKNVSKTIDIDFSKEVGKRKGSWKGGTIGCSYEWKDYETPMECIQRMEIEREF